MTAYDFDAPVERHGTDSLKFDRQPPSGAAEDVLSMWVADMDFKAPDEVLRAIEARARHGVFGYTQPSDGYYQSVASWMRSRHGWEIDPRHILITPGVVFALAVAVRAYTEPGDAVLLQPPVYYPFSGVVRDNGRVPAEAPLAYAGADGGYTIDFEAFERVAAESGAKLFLFCSPHNPVGRVWREDELARIADICMRYGITIVSDEIHADFVRPGFKHVPLASLSREIADNTVTLSSASKTFNIAGLQVAHAVIPDERRRRAFNKALWVSGYSLPNALGLVATQAAYDHGAPWIDALNAYLEENWALLERFVRTRIPELKLVKAQGTYLAWLDCTALGMDDAQLERFILKDARLWLDQGHIFGASGSGFVRINIATQHSTVERALLQLEQAVRMLRA